MHHHHSHSGSYLHNGMKKTLLDPVIGIVVKLPIQAKMDDDDEDHSGLHFGLSQESELDPPLVLESFWDCLGTTIDTTVDKDGKTIPSWRCGYCLIPGNCGGPRFFKHRNASKALLYLIKGKDFVTCTSFQKIPTKICHALTALMYSRANRNHEIAAQKNKLNEEIEEQQDCVFAARVER
jgi:hypothetical protein